jgi:hypothetical protein
LLVDFSSIRTIVKGNPLTARRRPRSGGYTLVELLLALGLLALLAGITVPSAMRMYADTQLAEAAEQVRLQLAGTRMRAIEGGIVYQFRFEPDGRSYVSLPYEREIEGSNPAATGTGATVGVGKFTRFAGKLAEGFQFHACCTGANATGGKLTEELLGDLPDASELAGVEWSPPILFIPDGAAIDGAFEVRDHREQSFRLEVRGLTGAASISRQRTGASE